MAHQAGRAGALLALAVLIAPLIGATRVEPKARVVAIRTARAEPYQVALDALRKELGDSVELRVEDVDRNDPSAGARIEALRAKVLVPLGTQATIWARDHTRDIPILFAMVLNPVSGGLIDSMGSPGGRISGASLDVSPRDQFEILKTLLGARRIGVLYNPDETGVVVRDAANAARLAGVELHPIEVHDPRELDRALERLHHLDALWSVADRTVLSPSAVERILLYTLDRQLPFMGLSIRYVRAGALLAVQPRYDENGRQAAALVRRVLAGASVASLPISVPRDTRVVYNPRTAKRISVVLRSLPGYPLESVQ
ncbi:MAG: ABC transporter substrate-binding protein [Myxococcota bacterium]